MKASPDSNLPKGTKLKVKLNPTTHPSPDEKPFNTETKPALKRVTSNSD